MKTDCLRNQRGGGAPELLLTMLLLSMLAAGVFTLLHAGISAQQRISQSQASQAEARVALAYLGVKLHQNDVAGSVQFLTSDELPGGQAIRIYDASRDEGSTWIYFVDGQLKESTLAAGLVPKPEDGFLIAALPGFRYSISQDNALIFAEAAYESRGKLHTLSAAFALRSDPNW